MYRITQHTLLLGTVELTIFILVVTFCVTTSPKYVNNISSKNKIIPMHPFEAKYHFGIL